MLQYNWCASSQNYDPLPLSIVKDWNSYFKLALDDEKTLAILMFVKPEGLLGNIKIADFFHYPVQA